MLKLLVLKSCYQLKLFNTASFGYIKVFGFEFELSNIQRAEEIDYL